MKKYGRLNQISKKIIKNIKNLLSIDFINWHIIFFIK